MILLTGARIFGILFSIAIPMYLGRKLSVSSYGTYKQLMLYFWFAQVALNLGVDDSAYYYLRWNPKKFSLYSFNALMFNLVATGLLWLLMSLFSSDIAHLIKNPEITQYLPILGFLTMVTVSSMQIEGILIGMNRFKERLMVEVGMELFKSLAIVVGFYFFDSIYTVLVLLSALMSLRLMATMSIILSSQKSEGLSFFQAPQYLLDQLKFGLPLGFSRILQNVLNMENFFISSYFSLAQFTYYSVGCFENPLVNAARSSLFELTNIEMIDAIKNNDYNKAVMVWRNMFRKLSMIIVPFVFYMIFFAHEIITFIFSDKYLASVPFFMLFNTYLIVGAINPEPLFRAISKTHLALKIKIMGLALGIILLVGGAYYGGAMYALGGKILGVFIMNVMGLVVGARLLKSHFMKMFLWKDLILLSLMSLVLSALLRLLFINIEWHPFFILALSFSLYLVLSFIFSCFLHLLKEDEIVYLKSLFLRFVFKR